MTLQEIASQLKKVKSATIFCHMRPDGDTLGAAAGLAAMLGARGAKTCVVCESPIPEKFAFLPALRAVGTSPDPSSEAYIAVDCSDEHRLGALADAFVQAKKPKFNIDHHISNTRYGDCWFVEERAATCEIMVALCETMGVALSKEIADLLLLGISSDTGNFAHKNVTASTFAAAAKLVAAGADINAIQYNMFKKQSAARALLFGRTMSAIRYFAEGRIAMIAVTRRALEECGATADVTEGFIDFPMSVDGVEVAACLLETGNDRYKVSLRSKGRANVNEVAAVYGGGGHVLASGCMLFGAFEEVVDKLRFTITQHLQD